MTKNCSYCQERPVKARGLCGPCYYRWKRNGKLEYVKIRNMCRIDGCEEYVVSNGLCDKHRKRVERHGEATQTRPFDWGKKEKHEHWHRWQLTKKTHPGRESEWDDFWRFVSDIGDKPHKRSTLRRKDPKGKFGPLNFYWTEPIADKPLSEITPAEYQRQFRRKNPRSTKNTHLRKRFGITAHDYERMMEEQDHKCAICGGKDDHFSLAVDHCHNTSIIRGLLCSNCNRGLGCFGDSPELLKAASQYLEARRL